MLRFLLISLFFLFTEFSFSADHEALKKEFLDQLPKRPETVQQKIDDVFENIRSIPGDSSAWLYNGPENDYNLLSFDSFLWLERFVKEHPDQKSFKVLDIGAAQYGYSISLIQKILASPSCLGKSFIIVSLDGEQNLRKGTFEYSEFNLSDLPKITEIRVDQFKVENLYEELMKRNLPTNYDLIVSNWCLRHLCDPIRVLWEAYAMLRQDGLFMTNGFFLRDSEQEKRFETIALFDFIHTAEIPCVCLYIPTGRDIGGFALKKDDELKHFPLEYTGRLKFISRRAQCHSESAAEYRYRKETPRQASPQYQKAGWCQTYWINSFPFLNELRPFLNLKDSKHTEKTLNKLRKGYLERQEAQRELKSRFLVKEDKRNLLSLGKRLETTERELFENLDFFIEDFSTQERLARRAYEHIKRKILTGNPL